MSSENKLSDIARYVSLDDEAAVKDVVKGAVLGLWDIVNTLTRLRPSERSRYHVSIFGSAQAKEGTFVYDEVKRLAAALTEIGCDIITGGGPGLMQAANEGAQLGNTFQKQESVGIRIKLPFEQSVNKHVEQAFEHQTFFTRLHHFALASDAFIVVPGGIGTVLETFMVWQLLQVEHLPPMPLILMGDMYAELVDWAKKYMTGKEQRLASPEDLNIPICTNSIEEAVEIIKAHREKNFNPRGEVMTPASRP